MPSTCTVCKLRDAIYMRRYSGEKLCPNCFGHSVENKVRATIAKFDMLNFDDRIAIAVSGGKDSMALLLMLAKLEKSFTQATMTAVTVDEGIRGYRDEALTIARKGCRKLGVEHIVVSFKEMFGCSMDELVEKLREKQIKPGGLTPCAYCGVLRRRALNSAARNCGATKLATAHNLDDEAQTILLNLLHGDPLRIARTRPVSSYTHCQFVYRVKPFCEILEKETTLYAHLKEIEFQSVPCPYAAAALRTDIRTMLNRMEQKHPGLKYTIYRSAEKLWSSIQRPAKAEKSKSCKTCGEPAANEECQPCRMLRNVGCKHIAQTQRRAQKS